MKCPECGKEISRVVIYSSCWQYGYLGEGNKINDYGSVEEVLETKEIACPECEANIWSSVKEG